MGEGSGGSLGVPWGGGDLKGAWGKFGGGGLETESEEREDMAGEEGESYGTSPKP